MESQQTEAMRMEQRQCCFADAFAPIRVREGLREYLEKNGMNARDLTNTVQPW